MDEIEGAVRIHFTSLHGWFAIFVFWRLAKGFVFLSFRFMRLRFVLFDIMIPDDDSQYPFEYSHYYHFHRVLELSILFGGSNGIYLVCVIQIEYAFYISLRVIK